MRLESSYIIHKIGPKIREIRKKKGILLSQLAETSGLSTAMISKTENGRVTPTLPALLNILKALEVEPANFFEEINEGPDFDGFTHLKKNDYKRYIKEESAIGFLYRSVLEKTLDGNSFQISHVQLEPGNKRPLVTTDAFEFLYVIKGEIDYYLDEKLIKLEEGDSLFFDGNIPHVPLNVSKGVISFLVIYFFKGAG